MIRYTCTDAASCQGVRVERAQRVQDNLMGNNHDTHRIAHTPPWPRSDCRNAGLYFLRMRTINYQLRTVLTHPTLPFSRIFVTLSFSFVLFLLLFDTANWKRLGTETFGNLALSVTSTKCRLNLPKFRITEIQNWSLNEYIHDVYSYINSFDVYRWQDVNFSYGSN